MNVSLTPELEQWVHARVASGAYTSASEVIREALRGLRDREEERAAVLADLRREIAVAQREFDDGGGHVLDDALVERIKRNGRRRLKKPA